MKKSRKLLALLMALLLLSAVVVGCAEKPAEPAAPPAAGNSAEPGAPAVQPRAGKDIFTEEIKIAYIGLSTAGITSKMTEKCFAEQLAFYPNIKYTFFDPMYDLSQQITMINECVTQGYSAIMLEALDTEALNNTIADAEKAGVPVITVNVGASGLHTLHVQGNDYKSGRMAAAELVNAINGAGNAVVLDCPAAQKPISLMGTGFEDYVKEEAPGVTLLESVPIEMWSTENANTAMRDLLTKYEQIDVVYCASDDIAQGAVQAIESSGRTGIKVYGSMGYPNMLQSIKNGDVFGTYFSDGYLEYTVVLFTTLNIIATGVTSVTAGYTATPVIDMPTVSVTSANIDSIISDSRWGTTGLYTFN